MYTVCYFFLMPLWRFFIIEPLLTRMLHSKFIPNGLFVFVAIFVAIINLVLFFRNFTSFLEICVCIGMEVLFYMQSLQHDSFRLAGITATIMLITLFEWYGLIGHIFPIVSKIHGSSKQAKEEFDQLITDFSRSAYDANFVNPQWHANYQVHRMRLLAQKMIQSYRRNQKQQSKGQKLPPPDRFKITQNHLIIADGIKDCSVCLMPFKIGDQVKQLKICKHVFHQKCVEEWNAQSLTCPLCREKVV